MITPRHEMNASEVGRHYDELDSFYREIWGDHVHHGLWRTGREGTEQAVLALIDELADAARIHQGCQVCDVGCGYGGTSRYLAQTRGALVTGYTVSDAQYRYAREKNDGGDNPVFRLGRWERNELADQSMDAVISIECFTHVPDKQAFFDEIYRVLKPGGRAAITVWMHGDKLRPWQVRHLVEPICYEGRLAAIGMADEYRELVEKSGLVVDDFQQWGRQVRRTWWICLRRLISRVFTSSRYRGALRDKGLQNRVFALTLVRILVAYHLGVMCYGFFNLRRPES